MRRGTGTKAPERSWREGYVAMRSPSMTGAKEEAIPVAVLSVALSSAKGRARRHERESPDESVDAQDVLRTTAL
jgi:hypothetical protein